MPTTKKSPRTTIRLALEILQKWMNRVRTFLYEFLSTNIQFDRKYLFDGIDEFTRCLGKFMPNLLTKL